MTVVNRLLAVLLGLAVAAAGVVLIAEAVAALLDQPSVLVDRGAVDQRLSELSWDDPVVVATAAALIALGLLLLLLQLVPRQPDALPLRGDADRGAEVDRKALASHLATVVSTDPDVVGASASVTKKRAAVRVRPQAGADPDALRQRLGAVLSDTLRRMEVDVPLQEKVTVQRVRERTP